MPLDVAKRGTLDVRDPPLKAIVDVNDNYEPGYHKGNAGGLDAIDTDLATANIKNGITIFGKAGSADVHDISDATAIEAEVITGETFYAASGGIRTGTMPIEALDPALNEYPAGYHAGAASLTAVDGDLVAGNIADGITIFGVLGTLEATLAADAQEEDADGFTGGVDGISLAYEDCGNGAELLLSSLTITTLASRLVVVCIYIERETDNMYHRIYIDDVQKVNSNAAFSHSTLQRIFHHSWDGIVTADDHTVKNKCYGAGGQYGKAVASVIHARSIKG